MQAAQWLVDNSSLYREEGITFNDTWLKSTPDLLLTVEQEHVETNVKDLSDVDCDTLSNNTQSTLEDEAETAAGVTDTMLTAPDFMTDTERQYILNVAPGEGRVGL